MPKRRDQIRMTYEEMWEFIGEQKSLQVATIGKDGMPHLTTLWFGVVDGDLVFETFTKSQKIVNLKRDPRISVLLEDGLEYNQLRGVCIQGRAELHTEPEAVLPYAMAVIRRNEPQVPEDKVEEAARALAAKRTGVVVKAERVFSWDHRKLGAP